MKRKKLTTSAMFISLAAAMFVTARAKDKLTTAVASAAVVSPVWLPQLKVASEVAALLMPFAGLIWLGVQIYAKLRSISKKSS